MPEGLALALAAFPLACHSVALLLLLLVLLLLAPPRQHAPSPSWSSPTLMLTPTSSIMRLVTLGLRL
jgi:hypothetical protein